MQLRASCVLTAASLAVIGVPNPHDEADPASDCPLPSKTPVTAPTSSVAPTAITTPRASQVSLALVNAPIALLVLLTYLISLQ